MNLEDLGNLGNFGTALSKTYPLHNASVQNVAYALSEYLDTKKNMITQTMRTRNGYLVQCKGDANADWTKYIGLDASVDIKLIPMEKDLIVEITTGKWLEKLGIASLRDAMPGELSGGELRRMAVARALIGSPDVVLADEPTGDLDDENTKLVLSVLREAADMGAAVLIVTHENEALSYADQAYRMQNGLLEPYAEKQS